MTNEAQRSEESKFTDLLATIYTRYAIDADRRIIRFYHGDIDVMSYWQRGKSHYEWAMKEFERTMIVATGLKRIKKTHDNLRGHVDYKLSAKLFNQAAVAVRMRHGAPNDRLFIVDHY